MNTEQLIVIIEISSNRPVSYSPVNDKFTPVNDPKDLQSWDIQDESMRDQWFDPDKHPGLCIKSIDYLLEIPNFNNKSISFLANNH